MKNMALRNNTRSLENFIKKANRKLLELEVMQSMHDIKNGRYKIYNSANDLMDHIESKIH